jgi:hypothetical protein
MTLILDLSPEREAVLQARAKAQGLTVEEWLLQLAEHSALSSTLDQATALRSVPEAKQAAVATILELQKYVKPDPGGWTIRDYIDYGRR